MFTSPSGNYIIQHPHSIISTCSTIQGVSLLCIQGVAIFLLICPGKTLNYPQMSRWSPNVSQDCNIFAMCLCCIQLSSQMENINFYYLLLLMLAGTNIFHSSIFMCIFITMVSLCCITTTASEVVDFYVCYGTISCIEVCFGKYYCHQSAKLHFVVTGLR